MSLQESLEYWPQSESVSSFWVKEHLKDINVKVVEVIYNTHKKESRPFSLD